MNISKKKETEMYVELVVSNFMKDFDFAVKKIKEKPIEITQKGQPIISTNNPNTIPRQLFDKNGSPRKWKENSITYRISCKDLTLETSLTHLLKIVDKLKKDQSFEMAKFGIRSVIYLKNERPNTSLSAKMVSKLARENCYLDLVLY